MKVPWRGVIRITFLVYMSAPGANTQEEILMRMSSLTFLVCMLSFGGAHATVDCDHKVEEVLADPYNVGWKLSGWSQAKVRCSSANTCSAATNLKEQLSLLFTAASTGMKVVVRYGGYSSCTDPAIVTGSEMGYYYRLIAN